MEVVLSYRLEDFEGPLDLLLQLIAKNKLNITDICLVDLIDQYLAHIAQMDLQEGMDTASAFLEMASRLIYIKTVSLLPKHEEMKQLADELTGELLEYRVCREMAGKMAEKMAQYDRFVRLPQEIEPDKTYTLTHEKTALYEAYLMAAGRGMRHLPTNTKPFEKIVAKKIVSVSSKIVYVMRNLFRTGRQKLSQLYRGAHSRSELVATFLAVLELCKANRVKLSGESDAVEISMVKEKEHGN